MSRSWPQRGMAVIMWSYNANRPLVMNLLQTKATDTAHTGNFASDTRRISWFWYASQQKNRRCSDFKSVVLELSVYLRYIKTGLVLESYFQSIRLGLERVKCQKLVTIQFKWLLKLQYETSGTDGFHLKYLVQKCLNNSSLCLSRDNTLCCNKFLD